MFCSTSGLEDKFHPSLIVTTLPSLSPVSVLLLWQNVCVPLGINSVGSCIVSFTDSWQSAWFGVSKVSSVVYDRWIKVSSCTSESKLHPGNWKWLVWKGEKSSNIVIVQTN